MDARSRRWGEGARALDAVVAALLADERDEAVEGETVETGGTMETVGMRAVAEGTATSAGTAAREAASTPPHHELKGDTWQTHV